MKCQEIDQRLRRLVKNERINTVEILKVIANAERSKAYLELGFPSLFEWLTRGHLYANAAAYRRIEAARLLRQFPEFEEQLKSGKVNLSNMCKAGFLLRTQERKSGVRISRERKREIVSKVEMQSVENTEKILIKEFPELARTVSESKREVINDKITRCTIELDEQGIQNLNRSRDLLGHRLPYPTDALVIAYSLGFLVKKLDLTKGVKSDT